MRREQHRGGVLLPARTPRSRNVQRDRVLGGAEGLAPSRLEILGIGGGWPAVPQGNRACAQLRFGQQLQLLCSRDGMNT
jgi:hypothetical protein